MDSVERIRAASSFLLQSPPGEINDVLNGPLLALFYPVLFSQKSIKYREHDSADVRNIISDDDSLQDGVLPALKEYNIAQFMTVDVPGTGHQVTFCHYYQVSTHIAIRQSIVSEAARLPASGEDQERFLDPRSKTSFVFDHLSLVGF